MPRIKPLPLSDDPEIRPALDNFKKSLGFVPNAALIMQRKPKMAKGFALLSWSMWGRTARLMSVSSACSDTCRARCTAVRIEWRIPPGRRSG